MAERFKAVVSSTTLVRGGGSNPSRHINYSTYPPIPVIF